MRGSVNWIAITLGGAGGFLLAALAALTFWIGLNLGGAGDNAVTGGIVLGVLTGTFCGGFLAGNAHPRSIFHGALTGVLLAGGITLVALGEGSPAPASTRAGFIIGAGVIGGLGGWVAHVRRQRRRCRKLLDQDGPEYSSLEASSLDDRDS